MQCKENDLKGMCSVVKREAIRVMILKKRKICLAGAYNGRNK